MIVLRDSLHACQQNKKVKLLNVKFTMLLFWRRVAPVYYWQVQSALATLTLFPVPRPTGGWHSAAWRTVHSMISIKAVSCLSVKAATTKTNKTIRMICITFVPLSRNTSDQVPSSPGNGSSSRKLIIHSQSFSSSGPHSQRESTRYAACSWSYGESNVHTHTHTHTHEGRIVSLLTDHQ